MGVDLIVRGDDPDWKAKIHEFTGEYKGADFAFECSGHPNYQRKALEGLRRYGKIYVYGFNPHEHSFTIDFLYDVMNRHIWITGGHDGNDSFRGKIIRMLMDPEVQRLADILITGEYNMSDAAKSFESLLTKTQGKHFLYPQENVDEYKANPQR
jgi:threonine dehydrogenase-like Zn-dependent dehydrogenase